mgnify:CR=1 FL=1
MAASKGAVALIRFFMELEHSNGPQTQWAGKPAHIKHQSATLQNEAPNVRQHLTKIAQESSCVAAVDDPVIVR